jgi:predicted RecB family nuclease
MNGKSHYDIAVLPGLGRHVQQGLRAAGIRTVDQFAALTPEELQKFKGIKTTAHSLRASAQAFVDQKPVWYRPLPPPCEQAGWMFDLETDPLTAVPWCLGWCDEHGHVEIALVANRPHSDAFAAAGITIVPHPDDAWRLFAEKLSINQCPIYHWTGYDAGVMRQTAPAAVQNQLLHRMHDLHKSFNASVRLPLSSTSLKPVSRYLEFQWSGYDDWAQAYWDYQAWLRHGHEAPILRACLYQRQDVEALGVVWQWLAANAQQLRL